MSSLQINESILLSYNNSDTHAHGFCCAMQVILKQMAYIALVMHGVSIVVLGGFAYGLLTLILSYLLIRFSW